MTATPETSGPTGDVEKHRYDVIVIGAGGSGLRAAIAAQEAGAKVAVVCKSLLGKAHTVMAEGGAAAAMGNVWPEDNWRGPFPDTMCGGKVRHNWPPPVPPDKKGPPRAPELAGGSRRIAPAKAARGAPRG